MTNANSNNISAYTINASNGALKRVAGSPLSSATPSRVATNPKGAFAYVTNNGSNTLSAYVINASSGALAPVTGSPFATGTGPGSVAINPTGAFAYVTNDGSNDVSAYTIGANGALTPAAGSPFGAEALPSHRRGAVRKAGCAIRLLARLSARALMISWHA